MEEDYVSDGDILEHYMRQLFHEGGKTETNEIDILSVKDQLEYVRFEFSFSNGKKNYDIGIFLISLFFPRQCYTNGKTS